MSLSSSRKYILPLQGYCRSTDGVLLSSLGRNPENTLLTSWPQRNWLTSHSLTGYFNCLLGKTWLPSASLRKFYCNASMHNEQWSEKFQKLENGNIFFFSHTPAVVLLSQLNVWFQYYGILIKLFKILLVTRSSVEKYSSVSPPISNSRC